MSTDPIDEAGMTTMDPQTAAAAEWTAVPAEIEAVAHMQRVVAAWTSVLYATDVEGWAPAGGHDPAK